MEQYALLRILLACFFLYIAWPAISEQASSLASMFWAGWLLFFLFVVGSNLAAMLKITKPLGLDKQEEKQVSVGKN
ncbi:hypothetical protein [Radiobacillus sp. PE A8.2]|uniref:hypothetical protein n=1 Tax=Radiobacillus sp. PE A8.2 TaxID=3380349 RepID=UPI003890FDF0